jgi:3-oxosteroid 1-dehydrogenase
VAAPTIEGEGTYDAILVGGGLGSLVAAIRLAERGLRPLIVEKSATIGGASAYSGGVVWAPVNHRMRAKGIDDSAAEALTYLESVGRGRWSRPVATAYVEEIAAILEWLERVTPLTWMTYPDLPDYFAERRGGKDAGRCLLPQPRLAAAALAEAAVEQPELGRVRESVHFPDERHGWAAGRALAGCLWSRVLELGTPYLLETRALRLLTEDGVVTGVELAGPAGTSTVRGRLGVLLNTGGFEWNRKMTSECVPDGEVHPGTPPTGDGDGHVMAAELGAALALMDQTISTPAIRIPGEGNEGHPLFRLLFQELTYPHSLVVNAAGERFANETFFQDVARGWSDFDEVAGRSRNLPMHLVFDDSYRREHGLPGALEVGESVAEHADLRSLARAHRIDPDGLEAQVRRLNRDARDGVDGQFGRGETAYQRAFAAAPGAGANPTIGAVETPPFYCLELFPGTSGHRGGVVIDPSGRVLDVRGNWLRGLYACGSAAAGLVTGATYLTGASVGQAIVFGVMAADAMPADAPELPQPTTITNYAGSTGTDRWNRGERI